MAFTGRSFRATEHVASVFLDFLQRQFPDQTFSLVPLSDPEGKGVHFYEVHVETARCPEEVGKFIDVYLGKLFPPKDIDSSDEK